MVGLELSRQKVTDNCSTRRRYFTSSTVYDSFEEVTFLKDGINCTIENKITTVLCVVNKHVVGHTRDLGRVIDFSYQSQDKVTGNYHFKKLIFDTSIRLSW